MRLSGRPRLNSDLDIVTAEVRDGDRDRYLSVLYAPAAVRPALLALFGLDLALERVVAGTTEPMIGAIRLAWWRDALEGLDEGRVPAQPLLALIAAELLPRGIAGAELALIEDRWAGLIGSDTVPDSFVAGGGQLFGWAARLLGGDAAQANDLGRAWAAGEAPERGAVLLRPLFGLAVLAARDSARAQPGGAREARSGMAREARSGMAREARSGMAREARGSLGRQWRLLVAIALGR